MWILPKQLHTSAFVPDTAALNLDLNESSQACAQSLFVRSKLSPARTWSLKWKRDSWTQHLSGRILKPFLGKAFEIAWTSLLEVTPASPLVQQESGLEPKTNDIFGPTSQAVFDFFGPDCASLKTSRDTSALDSEKSLQNWDRLVTQRRGEYSRRLNAARRINASECLSWPTVRTSDCHNSPTSEQSGERYAQLRSAVNWPTATSRDWKGAYSKESHQQKNRMSLLPDMVAHWPTPTVQEAGKIGNQANHGQLALSNHPALRGEVTREKFEKGKHGPVAPANPSTHGSHPGSWATPGKLNPRWVETLMGLPVGWTMPSCLQPIVCPASVAMSQSAHDAMITTQTVHALGQIAITTDNRTDELRLLGNGVVPATAALAFRTLCTQLSTTRTTTTPL